MEAAGLIEKVDQPRVLRFNFEDVKKLPPPIIAFSDVAFSYSGAKKDYLYRDLNFGIDMDSRYAPSPSPGPSGLHADYFSVESPL